MKSSLYIHVYYGIQVLLNICDLLSKNLISLHNSAFEINAIETHWVNITCYKGNFMYRFLIALVNNEISNKPLHSPHGE